MVSVLLEQKQTTLLFRACSGNNVPLKLPCLQLHYGLLTCCLTNMTAYRPAAPWACRAPLTSGLKLCPMWVHIYSIFLGYQLDGGSYFGTPASMQPTAHGWPMQLQSICCLACGDAMNMFLETL